MKGETKHIVFQSIVLAMCLLFAWWSMSLAAYSDDGFEVPEWMSGSVLLVVAVVTVVWLVQEVKAKRAAEFNAQPQTQPRRYDDMQMK